MSQKERQNGKGKSRPSGDGAPKTHDYWARVIRHGRTILWGLGAFLVVFAILFVSQVPPQIGLKVGEVSSIDVKAPQEVIDRAATERLKAQKATDTPEVWWTDPKVLTETKTLVANMRDKVVSLRGQSSLTTQEILSQLRPLWLLNCPTPT